MIVDAPRQSPAPAELIHRLYTLVGGTVSSDRIAVDLVDGARAYARWRDEVSAEDRPAELSHTRVWNDFVARRWPLAAREAVRRDATALSYAWAWNPRWALRPGISDALRAAAAADVPTAVVSNTLCGAAHRDYLIGVGLADQFPVQLYSDEAGVRKPNPELAWRAADALGVAIEDCWFVGDSLVRDVACARRCGAGLAVLMCSGRAERERPVANVAPDIRVDDGHGLLALLTEASAR